MNESPLPPSWYSAEALLRRVQVLANVERWNLPLRNANLLSQTEFQRPNRPRFLEYQITTNQHHCIGAGPNGHIVLKASSEHHTMPKDSYGVVSSVHTTYDVSFKNSQIISTASLHSSSVTTDRWTYIHPFEASFSPRSHECPSYLRNTAKADRTCLHLPLVASWNRLMRRSFGV
jgi:hypothetical protein